MKRPAKQKISNALFNAVKSLSPVLKSDGSVLEQHLILAHNWALAHNGIIAIGQKIEHDLLCCPNAELFISALSKCTSAINITQQDKKLSVSSGKFRASVPCIPFEDMQKPFPDEPIAPLTDRLKQSFVELSVIDDEDTRPLTQSVLIGNGTALATDGKVILESYHGCNTPTLVLPKSFIQIIKSIKKSFKAFGFSTNSFTIHLENDSWIKTQLWAYEWPDVYAIINSPSNPIAIPEDFWEALSAVEPFSNDGWIYTRNGQVSSHADDGIGALYDCYGIPPNIVFSVNQLLTTKSWAKQIDFFAKSSNGLACIKVFGDSTRAVIAGRAS